MDDFFEAILNCLYFLIVFCGIMMLIIGLAYIIIVKELIVVPMAISAYLAYKLTRK